MPTPSWPCPNYAIYPPMLQDRGLDAALSSLTAILPNPVEVEVTVEPRPPAPVETTTYFIVSETLANVTNHSGADRASVHVTRDDDTVVVEIMDNGHGGASVRPGGGLAGLADRAATMDGVLTVVSPRRRPDRRAGRSPHSLVMILEARPCVW